MKSLNIVLLALFSLFAYSGFAQTHIDRPVAKDVELIRNRQSLQNEVLLIVFSVDASSQTLSKDVQFISNRIKRNSYEGNMKSNYPVWIIGKDVNKTAKPAEVGKPIKDRITNPDVIVRG